VKFRERLARIVDQTHQKESASVRSQIGIAFLPVLGEVIVFERAFSTIAQEGPNGLLILGDALTYGFGTAIAAFAASHRLPAIYPYRDFVEKGGLMSYGPDIADSFRRAAAAIEKVLNGVRPAELPVEQPIKFELVFNLKIAKALSLTIPTTILVAADEVIE
jgi:putative tryptophan/tyrosine transport system substrate-binding protein